MMVSFQLLFRVLFSVCFISVGSGLQCKFLTFGKELTTDEQDVCKSIESSKQKAYCCYDPTRTPQCCDGKQAAYNLLMWLLAIVGILCVILFGTCKMCGCFDSKKCGRAKCRAVQMEATKL